MTRILRTLAILLLASAPALAWHVPPALLSVQQVAAQAVTTRDLVVYQGQAVSELLPATGLTTSGRGLRAHIRNATPAATVIQILTYNGASNARVAFDGSAGVRMTIGAGVSALWLVGAERVEWVYDVESYSLSDDDDVLVLFRGKFVVYGNRTRESDTTPSAQMPSGDGRYVRFDGEQGLSAEQQLQARENIGATLGSGDVVGPASVTDDRIAAFDSTTGKLIKQGSVTATAVASHLSNTSNPHSVTAAQAGADPAGTAASAVSAHAALTETHGISTYGASLVNDADAATARSTLGLGSASVESAASFAATSHSHAAADTTSGTFDPARLPAATETAQGAVELATTSEATTGTDTTRAVTSAGVKAVADTKQATLVSGTNIKTINSTSLLGSGDIAISASPGGSTTQPQYNAAGAFAGMSGVAWDDTHRSETRTGATLTASFPAMWFTQTWSNAAVPFTAFGVNVTNTASAAGSLLADFQLDGASKSKLRKDGWWFVANDAGITGMVATTTSIQISDGGGNPDISFYTGGLGRGLIYAGGAAFSGTIQIGNASKYAGDIFLGRNASGVAEFTNGSTGTFRDLKLRSVYGSGGQTTGIVAKSAAYTLTANDHTVAVDATSGALTMTLPAASSVSGAIYIIKKIDSSGNAVTIDGNASETIDGATTLALATQWKYAQIQCNGTSWYVIGSN